MFILFFLAEITLTTHTLQIWGVAFSPPKFQGWVFESTVKQVFFDNPPPKLGGKFHSPNLGGVGCQGNSPRLFFGR